MKAPSRQKDSEPLRDTCKVLPILSKISILGGLSDSQLLTVVRKMRSAVYQAGENVFEQGEPASHIYVTCRGRVKIVEYVDGTPMELVEYERGQCFGETSAIGILPHSATAHCETDTELLILSTRAIHELYHEDPTLFGLLILNIAREACRRLHRTDETMLHYAARKAP